MTIQEATEKVWNSIDAIDFVGGIGVKTIDEFGTQVIEIHIEKRIPRKFRNVLPKEYAGYKIIQTYTGPFTLLSGTKSFWKGFKEVWNHWFETSAGMEVPNKKP